MKYLVLISTFSVILPLLAGIFMYSRLRLPVRTLVIYLALTLLTECYAYYLAQHKLSNYTVYHWYMIVEYAMLAMMFSYLLRGIKLRQSIWLSILLFSLAATLYLVLKPSHAYASALSTVETVLIISWVLVYFTQLFRAEVLVNLYTEAGFWISTGLLIYFAGSFIGNGMYNYFLRHPQFAQLERAVKAFSNILMYLMFTIGILCRQGNQKLT